MIEIRGVRAVVTDIEGTTTSLAFVKNVLFPYARKAIPHFVRGHLSETREVMGDSRLGAEEMIATLLQWMDEDRKLTSLKSLQGTIWRQGYESGELRSEVYADAARTLRAWHSRGLRLYVYSSGSIAAQKLLFAHTPYGDLTPLFSGYFDTTTGPKLEPLSYGKIAATLSLPASAVVFLSDHVGEIDAAMAAGMQAVLISRDGGTGAGTFEDIGVRVPEGL